MGAKIIPNAVIFPLKNLQGQEFFCYIYKKSVVTH